MKPRRTEIPRMMPASAVAERLGRTRRWVVSQVHRGLFEACQTPGGLLVDVESVNRYLESCRVVPSN